MVSSSNASSTKIAVDNFRIHFRWNISRWDLVLNQYLTSTVQKEVQINLLKTEYTFKNTFILERVALMIH